MVNKVAAEKVPVPEDVHKNAVATPLCVPVTVTFGAVEQTVCPNPASIEGALVIVTDIGSLTALQFP